MKKYNTNENGTTWIIEEVRFDEFENGVYENPTFKEIASFPTYEKAYKNWMNYCSEANDYYGACDNQNYSAAYFFRIKERNEL